MQEKPRGLRSLKAQNLGIAKIMKGIVAPDIGLKSFGSFEKHAPELGSPQIKQTESLCDQDKIVPMSIPLKTIIKIINS